MRYQEEYLTFLRLFNEGRFYESLEVLQELWRVNPSNSFYKGLIQLAGALNHWEDKSFYWAENLFRSSADLLKRYLPRHQGLDLQKLIPLIESCADVAEQQRKDRSHNYRLPPLQLQLHD